MAGIGKYTKKSKGNRGYKMSGPSLLKMVADLKPSPITSPNLQVDWNKAPGVGTQERADWYKENNLAQDDTTKVKGANADDEVNVTETNADGIAGGLNVPKVDKTKTKLGIIGNTLVGAFTSGLDAVYGSGKVIPNNTVKFSDKKGDKKTCKDKDGNVVACDSPNAV